MPIRPEFTRRETEVIELLLDGKSNKQIASLLSISHSTVEFHLKNIYLKLGIGSRTEAILILSKKNLGKSVVAESSGNLGRSIGVEITEPEYGSKAKHFFDPKEEKAMRNRITISTLLSIAAILVALGAFAYIQRAGLTNNRSGPVNASPTGGPTSSVNASRERSRGILQVPREASTRSYDELLVLLRTPDVPFHYAAVFASVGCFVPDKKTPCAFTGPIPYTDGEWPDGPVSWRPDGEYGFYSSGSEILMIDHLERLNGKSDVLVPHLLTTQAVIHLSPDGRWIVESVQAGDPYAADLFLVKPTTGTPDKLDIGLEECFKVPLGWLSPTKFLFRCDIFRGATSKKLLSEVHYYTYDVLSKELLEFEPEMKAGFGALSPNGQYIIFAEKQGDLQSGSFQVKDLLSGRVYPLNIRDGQIAWSHDSSEIAIFADSGDIYVENYDGTNQKKIYSSGVPGYLSMEWFPDDKYLALVVSFENDPKKSEMLVLSMSGEIIHYDPIPTTDGYDIVDVSPLPSIGK